MQKKLDKINAAYDKILKETGYSPTVNQVSQLTGIPVDELKKILVSKGIKHSTLRKINNN